MATAAERVDRNTGQPAKTAGTGNDSFQQTTAEIQSGRETTTRATETTSSSGTSTQFQNILNAPGTALAALNQLLAVLQDSPNISEAELDARAPLPKRVYNPYGPGYYIDPKTGQGLSEQAAAALTTQRQVERQALLKAAGTTPGGTAEQRATTQARQDEIGRNREQQAKYSKEAAATDANALMAKALADALRSQLPAITQASEGAGTSKGSMQALLTQEAATRGAVEGAALGANLSGQYGQIYNQLAGVLEALTRQDPNSPTTMLLQAILGSKGMIQAGSTTTNQQQTQTRDTTQVQQQGPQASIQATDRFILGQEAPMPAIQPAPVQRATTPVMVIQRDAAPASSYSFTPGSADIFGSDTNIFNPWEDTE